MKNITRSLLVPTIALALPCLAFAQSGTSSSSSTSQSQRDSSQRDATGASSSYSASARSGADAKGSMHRVTEEQLENQLTAKALIGTDVHDSKGEKIGDVVDVVLAPSLGSNAMAHSSSTYQDAGVTGSTTRSATAGAPQSSDNKPANAGSWQSSANSAMASMQPAVIISTGGMMGVGNDLVRVPISRISYDAKEEKIRLNVTEAEWEALRDTRKTGGVTSTR